MNHPDDPNVSADHRPPPRSVVSQQVEQAEHTNPASGPALQIRPARASDGEAIRAVYNHEVLTSTATMDIGPRSALDQSRWMSERSGAHAVLVATVHGGTVVGFASLSPWRSRPAYNSTVEDSVYVAPHTQARGVGRLLLSGLIDTARDHGFHVMMARIVTGHEPSVRLHTKAGFELVGTEREVGRKFGRWHDVMLFEKLL